MTEDYGKRIGQKLAHACLIASVLIAILSAVAGNLSFVWSARIHWRKAGIFRDVELGGGRVIVLRLDKCQIPEDGNIYYDWSRYPGDSLSTRNSTNPADDPWKGEPIGFTVEHRLRFMGFEFAIGDFWPPFAWQHPHMPFTRMSFSFLTICGIGCIYPSIWYLRRYGRHHQNPTLRSVSFQ